MNALVAIPVFNEENHLSRVIGQVRRHIAEILVIDDGSTDRTPWLLRGLSGLHRITHPENRGYGQSLRDAFDFALSRRYDWLITMDCDEQHEPDRIPHFLEAAERTDTDVLSGTRYMTDYAGNSLPPADRRAINAKMTVLLNDLLGLNLTDAFCGFKAYRVRSLRKLRITIPGYAMPMQFWVQAVRARLRIEEIPVRLIYNDPNRHFGGMLDNPEARWQYYVNVLISELLDQSYFEHLSKVGRDPRARGPSGSATDLCSTSDR